MPREADEQLVWLCHLEYEGGAEAAQAEIAEIERFVRRMKKGRDG